jgi:hypothetical protein
MIRYLIGRIPEHHAELKAGDVIPVVWSRTDGFVVWQNLTTFAAFFREWGSGLDITRRDLFTYPYCCWLGVAHDDGTTLVPLEITDET